MLPKGHCGGLHVTRMEVGLVAMTARLVTLEGAEKERLKDTRGNFQELYIPPGLVLNPPGGDGALVPADVVAWTVNWY